ncbi:MAG: DUF3868 domain-containing protein [Odoribacter sp.]|nr:DUF3868 domain-containing protein [Odoribacter sp.]
MKNFIYILVLQILIFPLVSSAQVYKGEVDIVQNTFEQRGNMLYLDLDIYLNQVAVNSRQSVTLIPYLETEDRMYEFQPILLNGKNKDKVYNRAQRLKRASSFPENPYAVVKVDKKTNEKLSYQMAIPYESWMETAVLGFREDICECAGSRRQMRITLNSAPLQLENRNVPVPPPVIYTEVERVGKAHIHFPVDKYYILREFKGNAQELDKVEAVIDSIRNVSGAIINSIHLTGYASPEASYSYNENLSKNRANAMKDYLQDKYRFEDGIIEVDWRGEDWQGLRKLVEASNIEYKTEILNIIDRTSLGDGRDVLLKRLNGGRSYRYLLDNFYPELRRVDYVIRYMIKR